MRVLAYAANEKQANLFVVVVAVAVVMGFGGLVMIILAAILEPSKRFWEMGYKEVRVWRRRRRKKHNRRRRRPRCCYGKEFGCV